MANSFFPFLILLLLIFNYRGVQSREDGYINAEISNRGLDFLKDLLIQKAESSLVPLQLPKIEKSVKIPLVGGVHAVLSDIVIETINVTSSYVKAGDTGIVIAVSGATANLTMNWKYSYSTWLFPIAVSDEGNATIQVEGLEVGLTLSLKTVDGSLKLSLLESGCNVDNIYIKLDGGASWLYQGLIYAFEDKIGSAVEEAVPNKIKDEIVKLDSLLQSLPKEVPVTDIAALNVTFVDDPVLSESSVELKIDGLFSSKHGYLLSNHYNRLLQLETLFSYDEVEMMVEISLHEDVLASASSLYFEANKMHWIVDKVSDQSLLKTSGWRFIIPQLYKKYPNHDMNLNLSVSSLPTIKVEKQYIKTDIPLDVVIDVLKGDNVIPVACISMVIRTSVYAEISGDIVAGTVKLNDFSMTLKWSKIGELHMHLVQTIMSTTLRTVILPYANSRLGKGFQIPSFHGYALQGAQILFNDSWIVVGSNAAPVKQLHPI